jgi:hypothetical protein
MFVREQTAYNAAVSSVVRAMVHVLRSEGGDMEKEIIRTKE